MILAAKRSKSGAAVFGASATFTQLWDADADALGKFWPHAENGYDRSSADAALAQHLVYWTRKDCERIKRLMWQSHLRRDKWEREDYLPRTILKAVSLHTGKVHDHAHNKPQGDGAVSSDPANAGDLAAGSVIAPSVEHKVLRGRKDHNACFGALAAMQIEVRANLRKRGRMEVNEPGQGWSEFSDRDVTDLRDRIADEYWYTVADNETMNAAVKPLKFSITQFNEHLLTASKRNEVDPFKQWLEALPAWNGTARLDNWITRLFEVDSDPRLTVWTSRYLFLGAVQRTYEPGCKLDETPLLIGNQGMGKSAVLSACLPNDKAAGLVELFTDGLHLAAFPKERAEALEGRVIVEIAEMGGSTRADLESLKAFLTRTDDGDHRRAYARHAESSPRMCILVATADRGRTLPNDPGGNRRFVSIEIRRSTMGAEKFMGNERDQLWAEAVYQYKTGARANLPREYAAIQAAANENQRADDALEDRIAEKADLLEGKTSSEIAMSELIGFGGAGSSQAEQRRLSNAMQNCGFQRIGKGNIKVWTRQK